MAIDNFRRVDFTLDKANGYIPSDQFAKENDNNGRELTVQITDGGVVKDQSSLVLTLAWKHDTAGNEGQTLFTRLNGGQGIFTVAYDNAMMIPGTVTACIQIADGSRLTNTRNFKLRIEDNPLNVDKAVAEDSFKVFVDALAGLTKYDGRIASVESEVATARGRYVNLNAREDVQDNAIIKAQSTANGKFDTNQAESYFKSITVLPETFANLAAIKAKYPSGKNGLMVAADNGHKYIWNGSFWSDAGVYQSVGIADETVTPKKTNFISKNPKSINLFDKNSEDNWTGKFIDNSGNIVSFDDWGYSHSIPCKPGDIFMVGTTSGPISGYVGAFSGEQWVSNVPNENGYLKVPTNITVTSVRFALPASRLEAIMIVLMPNKIPKIYIPFNFLLDDQIKLDYANLENVSVEENDVTFLSENKGSNKYELADNIMINESNVIKSQTSETQPTISGKTVSIVGDSYSAFTGWIPEGNSISYNGTYNGVTSVSDMWWFKVIQKFNMSLMLNESWSGSTICNTGYNASDATATSFLTRITKRYGATNTLDQKPQVLFVLGGLNDTWAASPLGNIKYSDWTTDDFKTVLGAYSKMINDILLYNPGIEIINFEYGAVSQAIRDGKALICKHFGVKNVPISVVDSLSDHPTTTGMQQIVDQIITAFNV